MRFPRMSQDVLAAGALLVLGVLYGVLALDEGLGTPAESGAGFFPFVVAIVLVLASVTVLVGHRRAATPDEEPENEPEPDPDADVSWWRVGGVLLAALLVPLLADTVGMVVTLSVSLVLIAKVMGVRRWSRAVLLGVAFGAATWLIFVRWLWVPLPAGTLGLV
ncbi:tripartite tricarboxylate transporter TctB family protein [Actinophytocola gossypii]|uniref:Tripartite tricarboxylate transporter TctB family protein n=1 Tax=Actinophytocola gossypii TaxID=2812003 RepID=A0ABT2J1Y9_9PSEU|nr:tripartite tricarboxylate transporter TctB family protein [Actinophytocola gossypii]MCT2581863.1 tripartite tricarboxylate transporter TctB family protein [Actinophytocola gossypii]